MTATTTDKYPNNNAASKKENGKKKNGKKKKAMLTTIMSSEEILKQFKLTVSNLNGEANILITQVDPDAVGSAIILSKILEFMNVETNIHYHGDFGHPQNRAIANKYDLKSDMSVLPPRHAREEYFEKINNIVLVDSSLKHDKRIGVTVDPVIVIDHHRGSDVESHDNNFVWIEDVGSACTLVTELLRMLENESESFSILGNDKKLASLITLGIHTDTGALVSATQRDHEAYKFATKHISPEDIDQLIHYTFPPSHYRNMRRALEFVREKESRLIASLGMIKKEERDDLSTIAEWFMRKDGISFVVVWGIVEDAVQLSARCSNVSIDLHEFLKKLGGGAKLNPSGIWEGGAEIALGAWVGGDNIEEIKAMATKRMEEWILGEFDQIA